MNSLRFAGRFAGVLRRLPLIFLLLPMLVCRADIAVLREKGPWSGSAFSNLGVVKGLNAETVISMKKAYVTIHITRGQGETLQAKCEADFELEDFTPGRADAQNFLVAFPVSGLNSKIVTIRDFSVLVDGKAPGVVLRQAIVLSKRESRLQDTPVAGQLDAKFQLGKSTEGWGVTLADDGVYHGSYVWAQETSPGKKTKVKVSYAVDLRAQKIRYSKSYKNDAADREVIPFDDLGVANWDGEYYFFDYILASGSTWEGPIGEETIELTVDPDLQLSGGVLVTRRAAIAWKARPVPREFLSWQTRFSKIGEIHTLKGKPSEDMLVAISKSAIGKASK